MATIGEINSLPQAELFAGLLRCCAAGAWAEQVAALRPFASRDDLLACSDWVWWRHSEPAWLEAFAGHPKIGDVSSLRKKYANTAQWAAGEQAGMSAADDEVISQLAAGNAAYEQRFGFIFIVCATGKTARQMLELLQQRLPNERGRELRIAAGEQAKITTIRINKWLEAT